MVELLENLDTELLQSVLKTNNFKSMYGSKVRLTPVMD